ncbi:MAG: hypothetical protein IJS15_16380, partial [Victivallales bacterium]|nr:hypothetical protein [Victivallales bacterium]
RIAEEARKLNSRPELDGFSFVHKKNDAIFAWGAYGGTDLSIPRWYYDSKDRMGIEAAVRIENELSPFTMMQMKRAFFNAFIRGGGLIFPSNGQPERDRIKNLLDLGMKHGLMIAPSTYLTRHYQSKFPMEECIRRIDLLKETIGEHPALLGYHVVDEPGSSMMLDFMQGKEAFEKDNDRVPGLACANSIDTVRVLAPRVPLLLIDIYPMWSSPVSEPGCWAVPESVRYAKKWGAQNVWILPQAFGGSSWRAPTVPEFMIQFFGGLAYGATGFLPYACSQTPNWLSPAKSIPLSERGNLFDPFGNETELLLAMSRIAPLFRSAGPLFVGAEQLPDNELSSTNIQSFQSNTGKEYDCVGRTLRVSQDRKFRLLVVWGNDLSKAHSTTISLKSFASNEATMDLDSFTRCGNSIELTLSPGEGRIFAIADKATLDCIQQDVLKRRISIHDEILQLEIAESLTLPFDTSFLQPFLKRRDALLQDGSLPDAERLTLEAKAILKDNMAKDAAIGPVLKDMAETQASLARSNSILTKWNFPPNEAGLQAIADFRSAARKFMKLRIDARAKGLAPFADEFSSVKQEILSQENALQQFK